MKTVQRPICSKATCVYKATNSPDLCAACIRYVDQDYVPARESAMEITEIEKIDPSELPSAFNMRTSRPIAIPSFAQIFKEARLTKSQRSVLRAYFFDGKTFSEIAESLNISTSCAHMHFERGIKKAKKRLKDSTWVKDLGFKNPRPSEISHQQVNSSTTQIDPYEYYQSCPVCSHWDLQSTSVGGRCLKCGWSFSVNCDENLEE